MAYKLLFCFSAGSVGSWVVYLVGGWDTAFLTLLLFMAVDYVTGLVVAGVFHRSNKSETGSLTSKAGWKGLCRKAMVVLFVLVGAQLDRVLGCDYIRNAVIFGFLSNELLSIVENAGLMGLPLPKAITNALEALQSQSEKE